MSVGEALLYSLMAEGGVIRDICSGLGDEKLLWLTLGGAVVIVDWASGQISPPLLRAHSCQ